MTREWEFIDYAPRAGWRWQAPCGCRIEVSWADYSAGRTWFADAFCCDGTRYVRTREGEIPSWPHDKNWPEGWEKVKEV